MFKQLMDLTAEGARKKRQRTGAKRRRHFVSEMRRSLELEPLEGRMLLASDVTIGPTGDAGTFERTEVGGVATYSPTTDMAQIAASSIRDDLDNGLNVIVDTVNAAGTEEGNLLVQSDIAVVNAVNPNLSLRADGDLIVGASVSAAGGTLGLTLNANRDGVGDGRVEIGDGIQVNSNGGNIVIGGGSDPASTPATGNPLVPAGVTVLGNIDSGTGDISIRGLGLSDQSANGNADGVAVFGIIDSASGAISIVGTGGDTTGNGNEGIVLDFGLVGTTSGAISLTGIGGGSGSASNGVTLIDGGLVTADTGSITIAGTGAAAGSGIGIQLAADDTELESIGSAPITLTGIGSGGSNGFEATGAIGSTTASGDITITTDEFELVGALAVIDGTGNLVIKPATAATTIGVGGSAVGTLNLSDTELALLSDGFNSLTIGDANAGTGQVNVDAATFVDPVTLVGGSVSSSNGITGDGGITLTARDASTAGQDVTVSSGTIDDSSGSVQINAGDDFVLDSPAAIAAGSAGATIAIRLDVDNADAGVGSQASLAGSLSSNAGQSLTGDTDADTVLIQSAPSSFGVTTSGAASGAVTLDGVSISYTGFESVLSDTAPSDANITFGVANETLTFDQPDANTFRVVSSAGQTLQTPIPSSSFTLDTGTGGTDTVNVEEINTSLPNIFIQDGDASTNDTVNLNGTITNTTGGLEVSVQNVNVTENIDLGDTLVLGVSGAGGQISVSASTLNASALQFFEDATTFTNDAVVTAGDGIVFGSSIDGAVNLSVSSTNNDITMLGAIGGNTALASLTVSAPVINFTSTRATGNVSLQGTAQPTTDAVVESTGGSVQIPQGFDGSGLNVDLISAQVISLGAVSNTANLSIQSGGPYTITDSLTAANSLSVSVTDSAATDDNLIVPNGVTLSATNGDVTLSAGDLLDIVTGSSIVANGDGVNPGLLDLTVDSGTSDTDGGTVQVNGAVTPNTASISISGGDDADTFVTDSTLNHSVNGGDPTTSPGDSLTLNARTSFAAVSDSVINLSDRGQLFNLTELENITILDTRATSFDGDAGDDVFVASRIAGSTETMVDFNGVSFIADASVSIDGRQGADSLAIDFTNGVPANFIGFFGGLNINPLDQIILQGTPATPLETIRLRYFTENDGDMEIDGFQLNYASIAPITSTVDVNNVILEYSGNSETIDVTQTGSDITVDSTVGEITTFAAPNASIQIETGGGTDEINVEGLNVNLTTGFSITDSDATPNDTARFRNGATTVGIGFLDVFTGNVEVSDDLTVGGVLDLGAGTGGSVTTDNVTITSPEEITFFDALTLNGDTVIDATGGGRVRFDSTVDGANNLSISDSDGTVFAGNVGANTAIASLTVAGGSVGTTLSGLVRTVGDQTYGSSLILDGPVVDLQSTSGGTLDFAGSIEPSLASVTQLFTSTTGGTSFASSIGDANSLVSFQVVTGGPFEIASAITADGNIEILMPDQPGLNESLTLSNGAALSSGAGDVIFNIGDDVDFQPTAIVSAGQSFEIRTDNNPGPDPDAGDGGRINLGGVFTAGVGTQIFGGPDLDTVAIEGNAVDLTFDLVNLLSGFVERDGVRFDYFDIDAIDSSVMADNLVVDFVDGGFENISVLGSPGVTVVQSDESLTVIDFINPSVNLDIDAGEGSNTVTIDGLNVNLTGTVAIIAIPPVTLGDTVTLQGTPTTITNGSLDISSLNVDVLTDVSADGGIQLGDINSVGLIQTDASITSSGDVFVNVPMSLSGATNITSGAGSQVSFVFDITGNEALTVTGGNLVEFLGSIGTTPLSSLDVMTSAGGTITVVDNITTTGSQNYQSRVFTERSGGLVQFISTSGAPVVFGAGVGTNSTPADSLQLVGDLTIAGPIGSPASPIDTIELFPEFGFTLTENVNAINDVSIFVEDTAGADDDLVIASPTTVTSTSGSVLLFVGDDVDLQSGASISAGNNLQIFADEQINDLDTFGASVLVSSTVTTGNGTTIDGGVNEDSFTVTPQPGTTFDINGLDPTQSPADSLTLDAAGQNTNISLATGVITVSGSQPITITGIEDLFLSNVGDLTITGSALDETLTVTPDANTVGGDILSVAGFPFVSINNVASFTFDGGDGDDALIYDSAAGQPTVPVSFNGQGQNGASGGDRLDIIGTFNTQTFEYTAPSPDGNNGTVDLDGTVINYTGLEPINGGNSVDTVFLFNTGLANNAALIDGPAPQTIELRDRGTTFENTIIPNPTNSLTVLLDDQGDLFEVETLNVDYAASIIVQGGAGSDNVIFDAVTLDGISGRAIDVSEVESLLIQDSTITNNVADVGAGLRVIGGVTQISNTLFSGNEATGDAANEGGGAIFVGGDVLIDGDSNIDNNRATGTLGSGGGILVGPLGILTILDSTISNNTANRAGGGIEVQSNTNPVFADVELTNVLLENNVAGADPATASPGNGGGLHVTGSADVDIFNSQILNNTAAAEGGGLWNDQGSLQIFEEVVIDGNVANGDQGDGLTHSGAIDPATEGWTPMIDAGNVVGPVIDDLGLGIDAWSVNDNSTAIPSVANYQILLTPEEMSEANTFGWNYESSIRIVDTPETTRGAVLEFKDGLGARYTLRIGSDASGDPVVDLNDSGTVTLTGLGSGFHNYRMLRDGAGTAGLFVNGSRIFSNVPGIVDGSPAISSVTWGVGINDDDRLGSANFASIDFRSFLFDDSAIGGRFVQGGGGIFNNGGNVLLQSDLTDPNFPLQVVVSNNKATGFGGSGGGILSIGGNVDINESVIQQNEAVRAGGGIELIDGSVSITTTDIDSNDVSFVNNPGLTLGANPGNGGGIHITGAADLTIEGGNVTGNFAESEGGGIWNSSFGSVSITSDSGAAQISGNASIGGTGSTNFFDARGGGGIFNRGGSIMIDGSGNGVSVNSNAAVGLDSIGNGGVGGGLLSVGGSVDINDAVFDGNNATLAGGGISIINGFADLRNVQLTNNSATDQNGPPVSPGPLGDGGGLHIGDRADVSLAQATIQGNFARQEGGGIWNSANGTLTITAINGGSQISDNVAGGDEAPDATGLNVQGGGGIFNDGGTVSLDGSGDGILIENNAATGPNNGSGGGILSIGGDLTITDTNVDSNEAVRAGGGIELVGGVVNVFTSSISFNDVSEDDLLGFGLQASPGNGGGLHITADADVTLDGVLVEGNTAQAEGGGLWNSATGTLTLDGATNGNDVDINGNEALGDASPAAGNDQLQGGGGIFNNGGTLRIRGDADSPNVRLDGNSASGAVNGSGGAILSIDGTVDITAFIIENNFATRAGGGIEVVNGSVDITNAEFINNQVVDGDGGALHVTDSADVFVGFTFVNNNSASGSGGGLFNNLGTMTIENRTVIDGNTANGDQPGSGGGGIFNAGGTLNIDGSGSRVRIENNAATGSNNGSGGGILSTGGDVNINTTTINSNEAVRAGGGIEIVEGTVILEGTDLTGNDVSADDLLGLGLGSSPSVFTLVPGTFTWFEARDDAIANGGFLATIRSPAEQAAAFAALGGTRAFLGGRNLVADIWQWDTGPDAGVQFWSGGPGGAPIGGEFVNWLPGQPSGDGSFLEMFEGNGGWNDLGIVNLRAYLLETGGSSVPGDGGGLHISGGADVTVLGGNVSGNVAEAEGGGLWNSATGTLTIDSAVGDTTTINGNIARGDEAPGAAGTDVQGGGGIFNNGGTLDIIGDATAINNNAATGATNGSGGGILSTGGDVSIGNTNLASNEAVRAGGGIEVVGGTVTISNSSIAFNDVSADDLLGFGLGASPGNGGGLHITSDAEVTLSGVRVENNLAEAEGGGLWNSATGSLTLDGSAGIVNLDLETFVVDPDADGPINAGDPIPNLAVLDAAFAPLGLRMESTGGGGVRAIDAGGNNVGLAFPDTPSNILFTLEDFDTGNPLVTDSFSLTTDIIPAIFETAQLSGFDINGNLLETTGVQNAVNFALNTPGIHTVLFETILGNPGIAIDNIAFNTPAATISNVSGNQARGDQSPAAGNDQIQGGGGIFNNGGTLDILGDANTPNITISGNAANGVSNGSGGGILSIGGLVTISSVVIENNVATRAGGGIEVVDGAVDILNSQLHNNDVTDGDGGALHVSGSADVLVGSTTIIGNSASRSGGGLFNNSGALTIENGATIDGNTASGDNADQGGGGIFNNGGTVNISDGGIDITNNVADGISGSGGGILNGDGGTLTITSATIADNTANRAGGGIEDASGNGLGVTLTDATLTGNIAGPVGDANPGNGGGLHVTNGGDVIIDGGSVDNNSAALEGGGLWNDTGTMTIRNGTIIESNTASGDATDDGGGGIFNNGGTILITGATTQVSDNFADGVGGSGGGILSVDSGSVSITDATVTNNSAANDGGGIAVNGLGGSLDLFNTTISENTSGDSGGGILVDAADTTIANSTINNNLAEGALAQDGAGGGLFITGEAGGGGFDISDTDFASNTALGGGGGAEFLDADGTVTGGSFTSNIVNGNGITFDTGAGAIAIVGGTRIPTVDIDSVIVDGNIATAAGGIGIVDAQVTITDSTINNNRANDILAAAGGIGAIATQPIPGGLLDITGTTVTNNQAAGEAGGIGIIGGVLTLSESTVQNNSANGGRGGGIGVADGVDAGGLIARQVTVAGNTASVDGGGIAILNSGIDLENVTITANDAANTGGGIAYDNNDVGVTRLIAFTTISSNTSLAGGTNISAVGSPIDFEGTINDNGLCAAAVGVINSLGGNLDSGNSCRFNDPTDLENTDPLLGLLSDNGGTVETMELQSGSPAIDAGPVAGPSIDARGEPRPIDGNADGLQFFDIGSFEAAAVPAALIVDDVTVDEGDGTATVTVTLNNDVAGGFSVDVDTSEIAPTTAGDDYTEVSTQLNFAGIAGETQTFEVDITDDQIVEPLESILVSLSNPSNPGVDVNDVGFIDILDDDSAIVSVSDTTVVETDGFATVTIALDAAFQGGFTVDVQTIDGTAQSPDDYTATTETLTFNGASQESMTFTVPIIDDGIDPQRQNFFIQDTANNGIAHFDPVTGNDLGLFVASGAGGLDTPHNPTFGNDGNLYVASNGTNQILRYDGATGNFIDVFVDAGEGGFAGTSEQLFAPDGTLYLAGNNNLGVYRFDADGNFIDTIAGPADGVQLACGIEFGPDGNLYVYDTFDEEMRRFDPVTGNLIDVFIPAGNLQNACDFDFGPGDDIYITDLNFSEIRRFSGVDGTFEGVFANTGANVSGITFGPDGNFYVNVGGNTHRFDGTTGAFIDVFVPGRGGFGNFSPVPQDQESESFQVTLANLTPLAADAPPLSSIDATDQGTITILDPINIATLTVDDVTVDEANGTATVVVTLDNDVAGGFSIDLESFDNSASSPDDYDAVFEGLDFVGNAGETQTVTIDIVDDLIVEGTESFDVVLSNPTVAGIDVTDIGVVSILDDDSAILTVDDVSVNEAAGNVTVTVTIDSAVQGGFDVDFNTSDLSAVAPDDYAETNGTLSFNGNAGESQTFTVPIVDDPQLIEGDEDFLVELSNVVTFFDNPGPGGAIDDSDTATITITETPANVDLSVNLAVSQDPILTQGAVTYTIVVSNAGPDTSTNTLSTTTIPATLTIDNASTNIGSVVIDGTEVIVDLGDLDSGVTATITVNATAGVTPGASTITTTTEATGVNPFDVSIVTNIVGNAINSVTGHVFCDINGNNIEEPGEEGRDLTVFLDLNRNGEPDGNEPIGTTDNNGDYQFTNVGNADVNVTVQVIPGCNTISPAPLVTRASLDVGKVANSITSFDLDGDGDRDLLVTADLSNELYVLRNDNGVFSIDNRIEEADRPRKVVAFEPANGDTVVAVASIGSNNQPGSVTEFDRQSLGQEVFPEGLVAGNGPIDLAVDLLNDNDIPDIVAGSFRSSDLTVWLDGTEQGVTIGTGAGQLFGLSTGNIDPRTDSREIVVGGFGYGPENRSPRFEVFSINESGTFTRTESVESPSVISVLAEDIIQLPGEVTPSDEVLTLSTQGVITAYRFEDGMIVDTIESSVEPGASSFAVGDFNADGLSDIAVANLNNQTIEMLVGDGQGKFRLVTTYNDISTPTDLVVDDFNGDGIGDIAVTNYLSEVLVGQSPEFRLPSSVTILLVDVAVANVVPTVTTIVDFELPSADPQVLMDVNDDSQVTAVDALQVINAMNRLSAGEGEIAASRSKTDVNGDGRTSAIDALMIINHLSQSYLGEGISLDFVDSDSDDEENDNLIEAIDEALRGNLN